MLRFFGWLLLVVVILLAVAAGVVQYVLGTGYPRTLVLRIMEKQLGLQMTAESLQTGWGGDSVLKDVTLSLPLAEQSFLGVPVLRVKHSGLVWILLTQSIEIDAVELDKPTLVVRQGAGGKWNVQEVFELLARAAGKGQVEDPTTKKKRPKLPAVELKEGTLQVIDSQGRGTTISPVALSGRPLSPLEWQYTLDLASRATAKGEVSPGGAWKHHVDFSFAQIGPWMKPWVEKNWPEPASIDADWRGTINSAGGGGAELSGRLELRGLKVAKYQASGPAEISYHDGQAAVRPEELVVDLPVKLLQKLLLRSGQITIDGSGIRTDQLRVATSEGGQALASGVYLWKERSANVEAMWQDIHIPREITHEGSVSATIATSWTGEAKVVGKVVTRGHSDYGNWDTTLSVFGEGKSWAEVDWEVKAPQVAWQGQKNMSANDLVAEIQTRGTDFDKGGKAPFTMALREMHLTSAGRITGKGELNVPDSKWWLLIDAKDWPIPKTGATVAFAVDAAGDPELTTLNQLSVHSGDVHLIANGWYCENWPKPVYLNTYVANFPYEAGQAAAGGGAGAGALGEEENELPLKGKAWASAWLDGKLRPSLGLDVHGVLHGNEVKVNERPLGDVQMELKGKVDMSRASGTEGALERVHAHVETSELNLLGGKWNLTGDFPVRNPDTYAEGFRIGVDVNGLSMDQVGELLKQANMEGRLKGHWIFDLPRERWKRPTMKGKFTAQDFLFAGTKAGTAGAQPVAAATLPASQPSSQPTERPTEMRFTAKRITGDMSLRDSIFSITSLKLIHTEQAGEAEGEVSWNLHDKTHLNVRMTAAAWPVEFRAPVLAAKAMPATSQAATRPAGAPTTAQMATSAPATADAATQALAAGGEAEGEPIGVTLWGNTTLDIDLKNKSAAGPLKATVNLALRGQPFAEAHIVAEMEKHTAGSASQRVVNVRKFDAKVLGGYAEGSARMNLDDPSKVFADLRWRDVRPGDLGEYFPADRLKGLAGKFGGLLRIAPSEDPRALGPLRAELQILSDGGDYRGMGIGNMMFFAYADLAARRYVLSSEAQERSSIHIAGGDVFLWARSSRHENEPMFSHVDGDFLRLDLNQVVHAGDAKADYMPGRITGKFHLIGNPRYPKDAIGGGQVAIMQSDLVNFDPFAFLYALMNVGSDPKHPTGEGSLEMRLERGQLVMENIRYFNSGSEIRGEMTIWDVWDAPDSK
ncbi:MAG TPA: hypothetical protein VIL86_06880, partial [Tepidisphaeraceae bacterium]